jgi:hypothetical protein
VSAQGGEFVELPRSLEADQEAVEQIIEVFRNAQHELRDIGYPTILHVIAPGDLASNGPERHLFALVGPVAGVVDLWRQAARRSRT